MLNINGENIWCNIVEVGWKILGNIDGATGLWIVVWSVDPSHGVGHGKLETSSLLLVCIHHQCNALEFERAKFRKN